MRSIDLRVPAVAGFAILLLAFAPGAKAAQAQDIQFVEGTGGDRPLHQSHLRVTQMTAATPKLS